MTIIDKFKEFKLVIKLKSINIYTPITIIVLYIS